MISRTDLTTMGAYIVLNQATVRETARVFGVSKSKVHLDMTAHLPDFDRDLAYQVANQFAYHKSVRHIRGGEATRLKKTLKD